MSDLVIVKAPSLNLAQMEDLSDRLEEIDDDRTYLLLAYDDITTWNEEELKEFLGELVGALGWELDNV